jgi:hypothetical protein
MKSTNIKIVILQRGWVFVGEFKKTGSQCSLTKAKNIRVWGTSKGLGELAISGPIPTKTILDDCTTVRFHELTVIATLDCEESKWTCL